jgi:hypothetical protein
MAAFVNLNGISRSISENAVDRPAINASPGESLLHSCDQTNIPIAESAAPINVPTVVMTSALVAVVLVIASVVSVVRIVSTIGIVPSVRIISGVETTIKRETKPDSEVPLGAIKAIAASPPATVPSPVSRATPISTAPVPAASTPVPVASAPVPVASVPIASQCGRCRYSKGADDYQNQ